MRFNFNIGENPGYVSALREMPKNQVQVIPEIPERLLTAKEDNEIVQFASENEGIYFSVETNEFNRIEKGMNVKVLHDDSAEMKESLPLISLSESIEILE